MDNNETASSIYIANRDQAKWGLDRQLETERIHIDRAQI